MTLFSGTAAGDQDIDISSPEIEAIRASLKLRAQNLYPYLDAGQVGIARDGMLKIRTVENLDLRQRAALHRLVEADNQDRLGLYREIARANGFPDKVTEVRTVFAESWREKAASGWYLENDDGSWKRK
jgi:uncharacterized protein YdbL (DUF1318 family)